MTANGVKATWNFAHTDLKLPEDVIVESVHLSDSLMQLSYNMSNYKDKTQKRAGQKKSKENDAVRPCFSASFSCLKRGFSWNIWYRQRKCAGRITV